MNGKGHILITGGAGFIGSHLVDTLLAQNHQVTVLDNFDPYYDPAIKRANVARHMTTSAYRLIEGDILNLGRLQEQLSDDYDAIVHLAAKAGVRPSLKDPVSYQEVNVKGTQNLLEFAKARGINQFVFGSSSSVYGINPHVPWKESDYVLQPISPYASTKVSGELLGHVYSHLYGIRFVGLRFFSVYGPRQRPDLAISKFVRKITRNEPIPVYGDGSTRRDYTYVQDIVDGIIASIQFDAAPYEIMNIGNGSAISLAYMIETIEKVIGKKAIIDRLPDQPGDVPQTYADISKAQKLLSYTPKVAFEEGVTKFYSWVAEHMLYHSSR